MRFNASRNRSGFTLIELLVVVVILAVLAGALTLAMGGLGGERQLEQQAQRTQALIGYACEQAELVGRDVGVSVDTQGYRFSRRNGADWLPLESDELRAREWLAGTQVALGSDGHAIVVGDDFPKKPQLVCFSSGEMTPFRMELRLADLAQGWRLDGKPDGSLALAAMNVRGR
jgi:general secretion pathway protein H